MANFKSKEATEVHTTVRIPKDVHDRLRELAEAEFRTVSAEVRRLIFERVGRTTG